MARWPRRHGICCPQQSSTLKHFKTKEKESLVPSKTAFSENLPLTNPDRTNTHCLVQKLHIKQNKTKPSQTSSNSVWQSHEFMELPRSGDLKHKLRAADHGLTRSLRSRSNLKCSETAKRSQSLPNLIFLSKRRSYDSHALARDQGFSFTNSSNKTTLNTLLKKASLPQKTPSERAASILYAGAALHHLEE